MSRSAAINHHQVRAFVEKSKQFGAIILGGPETREALTASAETLLAFSRTGECEDSTLALQFVFVCIY